MKKAIIVILAVFGGLFLLGLIITGIGSSSGQNDQLQATATQPETVAATSPAPEAPPTTTKQYQEIFSFKGNGSKKSAPFYLSGSNARLKYSYNSGSEMGGVFGIYVVEQGHDVMKQGGFTEVMISEDEDSETYIQKNAGEYYLNVNAMGSWKISVEELR